MSLCHNIEKTKEKISEQQKRLRTLEAQLTEEENLEIVRMVKAVKMDNRELTAFLKAYASGLITLPEGMMEADLTENDGTPEITVSDDEDTAGGDNAEADGDALDQITELLGGLGTVTVTEDGILFTPDTEKWETRQTGTVTTCGGNLNVRTGAGLDNDAFTQLPDGAQVEALSTGELFGLWFQSLFVGLTMNALSICIMLVIYFTKSSRIDALH